MRAKQAAAIVLALATACGRAQRRADARSDSLEGVLQHQQDSLKGTRAKAAAVQAAGEKAVADSLSAERARPRDLTFMSTTGVTVAPNDWAHYAFVLDSAADCMVHGHIEVQPRLDPTSHDDVEIFLFTADDYANWRSNSHAHVSPLIHAGPQTATTLSAKVMQSGTYHLVVSNRFSVIAHKTAQGQVTVTCRGLQPHQP